MEYISVVYYFVFIVGKKERVIVIGRMERVIGDWERDELIKKIWF